MLDLIGMVILEHPRYAYSNCYLVPLKPRQASISALMTLYSICRLGPSVSLCSFSSPVLLVHSERKEKSKIKKEETSWN